MTVNISGMSCGHCIQAVEKALNAVKGIKNLKVVEGKASFDASDDIDKGKIKSAIEDAGYEVESME